MTYQRDGIEQPIKKFVDNTFTIAFARLFMPVALAIIGFLMITTLNDVRNSITQVQLAQQKLSDQQQIQAIDLAKVQVKVEDTTDKLKSLQRTVNDVQTQVQVIKNSTHP